EFILAINQARQGIFRCELHQQVHVVGLAVELSQLGSEVAAYVAEDRFQSVEVGASEHRVPILGDEHQVCVHGINNVATSAEIVLISHETNCTMRASERRCAA